MVENGDCGCEQCIPVPTPEPAHPRDTPDESALSERECAPLEDYELVREENARLKELLGGGPAVIVGVENLPALVRHLGGEPLDLRIGTWQFPERAVAYVLEAALEVAKNPVNGLCADSAPTCGEG